MSLLSLLVSLFGGRPRPKPAPKPKPKPAPATAAEHIDVINHVRTGHGLMPVTAEGRAEAAAKIQTDWQAFRDRIGHDGPSEGLRNLHDRLDYYGLKEYGGSGEIAAQGEIARWADGAVAIPYDFAVACNDWLKSPGHKAILLNPTWVYAGAAMATAESGRIYCTAVFWR